MNDVVKRSEVADVLEKAYELLPRRDDLDMSLAQELRYVVGALRGKCEDLQKDLDGCGEQEGCPECGHGYRPEHVEVDEEMRRLVSWRDSLALDSWGEGLAGEIAEKLKGESRFEPCRVPEPLLPAFRRFMEMEEEMQYRVCFAVLGE